MDENLSIAEEVMLLMLHDSDGSFIRVPDWSLRYALSGAVLMDLALRNRIDTDLNSLSVTDNTATGDTILDGMLKHIAHEEEDQSIRFWVERTAVHAEAIREAALAKLVERGILSQEQHRFLWVFKSRRYPVRDDRAAEQEVKLRIVEVLLSNTIPDPHDVVLICLTHATGILNSIFARSQLRQVEDRVEDVRRLDLIGQAIASAIWDIEASIATSSQPQFH